MSRISMHRQPFSVFHSVSTSPIHKLHFDIWGPTPCPLLGGYGYYVTIIDDCIKCMWIFPVINKLEIFPSFLKFHAFVKSHYNVEIKYFQNYGGGEYINTTFKQFLDLKRIVHQKSRPYILQQNGVAERKNKHIIETNITLLTTANLPISFWCYVVSHAPYFGKVCTCSLHIFNFLVNCLIWHL